MIPTVPSKIATEGNIGYQVHNKALQKKCLTNVPISAENSDALYDYIQPPMWERKKGIATTK